MKIRAPSSLIKKRPQKSLFNQQVLEGAGCPFRSSWSVVSWHSLVRRLFLPGEKRSSRPSLVLKLQRNQAGRLYSISRDRSAQTIRAFLWAKATAALLAPRVVLSFRIQTPRASVLRSAVRSTDRAPWMSKVRSIVFPRFEMRPNTLFPPLECCRGTSPSLHILPERDHLSDFMILTPFISNH
jgi:hypothetical protein